MQKNLMKCCKEMLLPDGKQIPFCAYNTLGYREQAREQLEGRERRRSQARRKGVPFAPEPLTFAFDRPYPHQQRGPTNGHGNGHAPLQVGAPSARQEKGSAHGD